MKTKTLITRKTPLYFLIGFLSLAVTSCGSYQNSSYYDNDGVYNTNGEKVVIKDNQPNSASVQYKQYFSSLQSTSGSSDEIFTDVNSYGSNYNVENDSIQTPSTGYASWGSSPESTTVVVYPDSYWSIGFGWGYPYYGYPYYGYPYYGWGYPGYGWGYPGYGWGYPGYGWGYPGYGYGHAHATPYAYNYSRRGSSYGGNYNNYTNRVNPYSRNSATSRNSVYNRNSVNSTLNRTAPTFTNRNSNSSYRNYTQNQSRSSYSQGRTNTSSSSYQRSSYTPSSNNTYRSSGSSMSSGGGGRSYSGGGGRMGGGGRR